MKKWICLLLFVIPITSFGWMNICTQGGGTPAAGGAEAGCEAGYDFTYNGDHSSGTNYGCDSAGSGINGTNNSLAGISSDYITVSAANQNLDLAIDATEADIDQGTICFEFYVESDGDTATNPIFEFYVDANNWAECHTADVASTDYLWCVFRSGGVSQSVIKATTIPDTWVSGAYTWQTGADTGGKHSVSDNNGSTWTENVEDIDTMTQPDTISLGEKDVGTSSAETIRLRNFYINGDYQGSCP